MTSLAFAGAGWVSAVHGMALAGLPDLRVTRVASRTRRAAERRADQLGAEPCDYTDLPGDADAVIVATPPAVHLPEARRAVEGHAAVLVEAPVADTLAAADQLVALAGDAIIAYGENLVHAPAVAEALRGCRLIGALTFLEIAVGQERPHGGNHLDPSWGGGALFDPGAHAIGLALLLAAPARAVAVSARLEAPDDLAVDDHATATIEFEGSLRAEVRASWRSAAPIWHAQAASPTGAVRLELVPGPSVEVNGTAVPLPPAPVGLASSQLHDLGYVGQLAALAADARARRPPRCGPAFGRAVLDVICAAYASAASGRPEPVPFTGPRHLTPLQLWRRDAEDEPPPSPVHGSGRPPPRPAI